MHFEIERPAKQKSWRRQCVEMLWCLLALIWVANPNFHSFSHLIDLSHQHPTGSIYSHNLDPGDLFVGFHESLLSNQTHPNASLGDNGPAARSTAWADPRSPNREPSDSDAPIFYMHLLEGEACCSVPYEVFINQDLPVLDEPNFECIGFFSAAQLGAISARGPPIVMAVRYL